MLCMDHPQDADAIYARLTADRAADMELSALVSMIAGAIGVAFIALCVWLIIRILSR